MSKELLRIVINDGVKDNLNIFFCDVSNNYSEIEDDLSIYDDDRFTNFQAIGEVVFNPNEKLVVVTTEALGDLIERSGKKAQYEKAKKILKDYMKYDAGIFVFSDPSGSFRFSLIYGQAEGTRKSWSNFRRFTYFVSRDQTNNTFLGRVGGCDFSSLDIVKDAFSVEKVNKEFYKEIAKYYYRLTGKSEYKRELVLPSVGADDDKKYEEFAVRLIGRIIFCWFLKHKKSAGGIPLISKEALSLSAVRNHPNYYHSILEPLFFEVMNKQIKDRKTVTIPQSDRIPFLNGGLFEPHVNDYYQNMPNYALKIPDRWFEDFLGVLEQYNFTIDENSTVDADVSVDPEMLGRIFENLLAEVVPETGETARKATGSYYTPRVIVDYMVEQSLKQYLLTKAALPEDKLNSLLSYEDEVIDLTDNQKNGIVTALKEIKVIDPACGSGAFLMGILHRMLLAQEKVDPKLEIWRRLYLSTYHPVMRRIIEDKLRKGNEQYIRKLTVIQDSIYGVDIQPIAVEIAKLRCFLSLVVDELVLDNEENRGIEPLPNLEFKFVAVNTLIGLPSAVNQQGALAVSDTVKRLKELRESYLRSFGAEKVQIEKEFRATQQKLFKENVEWALSDIQVQRLTEWDPFSYHPCGWFEPEWMFGIEDRFDIVIANPPYIQLQKEGGKLAGLYKNAGYMTFDSMGDIYTLFYENGIYNLRNGGCLCFITSNKWMRAAYGEKLREFLSSQNPVLLIDLGPGIFESATVDTNILIVQKSANSRQLKGLILTEARDNQNLSDYVTANAIPLPNIGKGAWFIGSLAEQKLKEKIEKTGKPLKDWDIKIYRGILTGLNEAFIIDAATKERICKEDPKSAEILKPILRGRDIRRYGYKWAGLWLIQSGFDINVPKLYPAVYKYLLQYAAKAKKRDDQGKNWWNLRACVYYPELEKEKIAWIDLSDEGRFSKVDPGIYVDKTLFFLTGPNIPYLLGVLNSKSINWYFDTICSSSGVGTNLWSKISIESLPVPKITSNTLDKTKRLGSLVEQVEEIKNSTSSDDTKLLEEQIDRLVYELYGLTPEEIAVVEGYTK